MPTPMARNCHASPRRNADGPPDLHGGGERAGRRNVHPVSPVLKAEARPLGHHLSDHAGDDDGRRGVRFLGREALNGRRGLQRGFA